MATLSQDDPRFKPLTEEEKKKQSNDAVSSSNPPLPVVKKEKVSSKFVSSIVMNRDLLDPPHWVASLLKKDKRWWEGQMANALFCPKNEIINEAEKIKSKFPPMMS